MNLELSDLSPYHGMIFMGSYTKKDTILIFSNTWSDPMDYYPMCGGERRSMDLAEFIASGISWESLLIALHDVGEGFSTLLDMFASNNENVHMIFLEEDQINKEQG